jgi:hypothetical protein
MGKIGIDIYTDLSNIELKKKYQDFENRLGNVNLTTSYAWISKWWELFADYNNNKFGFDKKLRIAVLYEGENIVCIAPLVILNRKMMKLEFSFLEFIGQQWSAIYCDLLSVDTRTVFLDIILEKIFKEDKIDIVYFNHIPDRTRFFNKDRLLPYAACPEVDLTMFSNMGAFRSQKYSKNLNQNIRTAYNRAIKDNVTLKNEIKQSDEVTTREIVRIAKTKLADGKDFKYADERKTKFRIEIMSVFRSNHCFIYANNYPIAYRTNVIYNSCKFCLDASYDREYPKYELGSLSVDANINDSYNLGLIRHCMGPGLDFYKLKFATHIVHLNYYIRRGNSMISFLIYVLLKFKLKRKSNKYIEQFNTITNSIKNKIDFKSY